MLQIARDKGDSPSKHVYVIGRNLKNTSDSKNSVYWKGLYIAYLYTWAHIEIPPRNPQVCGLLKPGEGPVELVLTLKRGT